MRRWLRWRNAERVEVVASCRCVIHFAMVTAFKNVRSACAAALIALAGFHANAAHASADVYGSARCGGAPAGWQRVGAEYLNEASTNAISLKNLTVFWNWSPVSDENLNKYIEFVRANPSNMVLIFDRHSSCAKVLALRNLVRKTVKCTREVACVEYTTTSWRASRMWRLTHRSQRE